MNIEKLFKKAEQFFMLRKSDQKKKEDKKEKLKTSLENKIASLKKKLKKIDNSDEKKLLKKHLGILKEFLEKLK